MSAMVTDLKDLCEKEEPIYVGIAVVLACVAMMLFLDGWLIPFVFLLSIGMMIMLNQRYIRRNFLHNKGVVCGASARRHNGLFNLPVAQL